MRSQTHLAHPLPLTGAHRFDYSMVSLPPQLGKGSNLSPERWGLTQK